MRRKIIIFAVAGVAAVIGLEVIIIGKPDAGAEIMVSASVNGGQISGQRGGGILGQLGHSGPRAKRASHSAVASERPASVVGSIFGFRLIGSFGQVG